VVDATVVLAVVALAAGEGEVLVDVVATHAIATAVTATIAPLPSGGKLGMRSDTSAPVLKDDE